MNDNTIWINDLDKLVNEYNNSYHRSIKMKPILASKKSNENIVRNNLYNFKNTNKKPKFSIGDRVRVSLLKNTFEKSYTSNWSEEIFIIETQFFAFKVDSRTGVKVLFYTLLSLLVGASSVLLRYSKLGWGMILSKSEISTSCGGGFNNSEKCSFHLSF